MLKLNLEDHTLKPIQETQLKSENILERYDLQRAIVSSWEYFRNEVGMPSSYLIGQEISPHDSTQDSIDLIAYDPDDSSITIIELKRGKHKLQLLQALTYAAMVRNWDRENLISAIQRDINPEPDELIDLIKDSELSSDVKIILVSEMYDPEVIITADWLSSDYSVNISAYAIAVLSTGGEQFIAVDQRYPLKDLADVYDVRRKRPKSAPRRDSITWEDVLPKLNYPFARRGIELCTKVRPGDPGRRRFGSVRSNYDNFTWISLNFRAAYINVYIKGSFDGDREFLQSKFTTPIEISSWRDGLSFLVSDETQFEDLVKWLGLE